ncbi:unnamed protein product [Triticum turgidum subsp. durum]|uniref:COP1-interacting protein 7 n=1 Tax=Triticum turgidum subsp. durum TaxID=4567 RepID=A0A9R0S931_TRITD|nr:unnamed protein product [Triticum turgidum subsp. durum]
MEGRVAGDVELDSAVFQVSLTKNRYEAIACNGESAEPVASGPFDQLVLHLEDAKNFQSRSSSGSFKLLLAGDAKGSTWFTKSTLERFLHIINSPDASKTANGILQEMSQLEETRKFHDYLQSKEQQNLMGGALTGGLSSTVGKPQQGNIGPNSSVATKNELLRALDLRLSALKEEILVLLSRAVGSKLLNKEVSDLSGFVQHFGTSEFSWLVRCLLLIRDCQPSVLPPHQASTAERKDDALETRDISSQTNIQRPITSNVSPAKLAQVERKMSMESDDSSESTDEDEAVVERSRPLMRSASPRRSASPMRRVQIGRSGSRRSTPIAIKSLSYFPPSQRVALDKDDESSCNGETDQPPRRSDNNVRRMSVQDAISLFEKKQKGENLDSESKKAGLVATKSVLRRWSSGMGDSLNSNTSGEKTSDSTSQSKSNNMASDAEKNEAELQAETDAAPNSVVAPEAGSYDADGHGITVSDMENVVSSHSNISAEQTHSGQESNSDRAMASAEWNRQKEAELNQMLMKMMEVMPGKFAGANVTATGLISASEKKGGLQREKRDTKVRTEKGVKRPAKETSTKLLKESVGQNRAAVTPKTSIITEKRNSPIPQRARRNSSPPVLPKEVISKTPAKKSSPKPSPAPATRSSWSGSLTKATSSTAQKTKNSPGAVSTSTPTSRRRTATASLAPQPISKVEKPLPAVKNKKEPVTATKPAIKGQEDKKTRTATKPSRVAKSSPASEEKSSAMTKSGMYNKVPKKSSVVPVEPKPVKKATGISQGVGSGAVKSKVPQLGDSSKGSGIVTRAEDKEQSPVTTEPTTKVPEADLAQPAHDVDENLEISIDNDLHVEKTENPGSSLSAAEMGPSDQVEPSVVEVKPLDEDMDISSAAWVEVDHQEVTDVGESVTGEDVTSPAIEPLPSSSPRIRHSLSQMLQADSNEPEIIEWGNAENPPAIVFHKDSPKGFKRLLKFARKNKGDNNTNGLASPSVVSDGEDEQEESGAGDGVNSSRRTFDGSKTNSVLSLNQRPAASMPQARIGYGTGLELHRQLKAASRSFFSLSNFRSSKTNESKLR